LIETSVDSAEMRDIDSFGFDFSACMYSTAALLSVIARPMRLWVRLCSYSLDTMQYLERQVD